MKLLLLLTSASFLFASQSLVMTSAFQAHAITPASGSAWNSISSIRIEGCVTGLVPTVGNSKLYDSEDGSGFFTTTTALEFRGLGGISGPAFLIGSVPEIASITNFRWRWQRTTNGVTGTYTLEIWDEQTGRYYQNQIADASPGTTFNFNAKQVGPGSVNGFVPAAAGNVGCLRISNVVLPIGSTIPPRLLTTGFSNMGDWEFEGVLTDQSPLSLTISVTAGGTNYLNPTQTFPPVISLSSVPLTTRAAFSSSLAISGFTNTDDPSFTCSLKQDSGAAVASFDKSGCAPTFTGPIFGQYGFTTTITDSLSVSASSQFTVGAVATDVNGVAVVANAAIDALRGPQMRVGASSYSWMDDRRTTAIDAQVSMLTSGGPNNDGPWRDQWNVADSHGTVSTTYANHIVTGSGTQFQATFCGGGTVPVAHTSMIVIWYDSADYPGTTGRGFYIIDSCDSQTQLTLHLAWGHSTGTQTGLSYNMIDEFEAGYWTTYNTPGNYYDNVSAYHDQYLNTGLTKYLDAFNTLVQNFWTGPYFDRGKNFDTNAVIGGNFISACCGRSESLLGLIRWYLASGGNIWPGMHYVWNWHKIQYDHSVAVGWQEALSDPREAGYLTTSWALCQQFDTDATWRTNCNTYLKATIDNMWTPLQLPTGEWNNVLNTGTWASPGGGLYVTATTGSPNIVLTGSAWGSNYGDTAWFVNSKLNSGLYPPGNSNSVGESVYYGITYVDGTRATLDRPYAGTGCGAGCQKGLITGFNLAAFGTEVFMEGIWGNQAGSLVYNSLVNSGDASYASRVRQFSIDSANWISTSPAAFDSSVHAIYYGANFLNCLPVGSDPSHCGAGLAINGETLNNLARAYKFTGSTTIRNRVTEMMVGMWCKPTGGWTCPQASYGTFMFDIDSNGCTPTGGGYMVNCADTNTNKWVGFFFGYGKTQNVEAELLGGVRPADPLSLTTYGVIPTGGAKIRLTVQAPNGTITVGTPCSGSAGTSVGCSWTGDRRQGNHLLTVAYLTSGDVVISTGQPQVITVQ